MSRPNYFQQSNSEDFYDPANWSNGTIPQQNTCDDTTLWGSECDPLVAVANAAAYGQISSLTVGPYATLKITATGDSNTAGNVFAVHAFEVLRGGELIIDTPAKVELGLFTENSGTVTIVNNNNNVVFDGNSLNGDGTLNLINSTLGSASQPLNLTAPGCNYGGLNISLQGGSTLYTGWYSAGQSVTFDPTTVNTLVLNGSQDNDTATIYGYSENAHIAIDPANGQTPVSAAFSANDDGSYSLTVTMSGGHTVVVGSVHTADGFVPGDAAIAVDASGNYYVDDSNAAGAGVDYSTTDEAQFLAAVAEHTQTVGGDPSQYTDGTYSAHSGMANDHFIGTGTAENPANWYDTSNWDRGDIPQNGHSCWQASIEGWNGPVYVEASQATTVQFVSLSIMQNATLLVNAPAGENPESYVFATQGVEIRGNGALIIDTAAPVELGGVSAIDGTLTIKNNDGNVIFDQSSINGGGTLNLDNATLGTAEHSLSVNVPTLNMADNSKFYASFYGTPHTVNFDNSINEVVLNGNESTIGTAFNNVSANTRFAVDKDSGLTLTSAVYSQNTDGSYALTMKFSNGHTTTISDIHATAGFTPGATTISKDVDGDWIVLNEGPCFLQGTLIHTDHGDVAVEDLTIGDMISVVGDHAAFRPVVWVGSAHVIVQTGKSEDAAGYPVRIVRNAFGENLPARDLLVTAEHCIHVEDRFVPVRMLVNGSSIFYDRSITEYRYFHVETDVHSVILAEGLETESYLDTGNRRSFTSGRVVSLCSRNLDWSQAAAELETSRTFVEPIHARLAARATDTLGLTVTNATDITTDARIEITTMFGTPLRRVRERDGMIVVSLPEGVNAVRIMSRASRPSDVVGPFCDDRRMLGLLVGEVTLWDSHVTRSVNTHMVDAEADGWHGLDHPSLRWTNGAATLLIGERQPGSVGVLSLQIAQSGPYLLEDDAEMTKVA
ncbi:Hint domain-containing protein [Brytella acorum]|uniref:Hint domain-containing protein n=1 Tax=Brytella acorum TaxID=2959299 RepID=A0AA35VAS3_9PROT|nr:Hint domain-containing protein [Brytella acorum]MDF3624029.1 Hint domain-containing protein [Brytella acorum]CAI9120868.1 Hint domain-containing protein [Brytella acorum]